MYGKSNRNEQLFNKIILNGVIHIKIPVIKLVYGRNI